MKKNLLAIIAISLLVVVTLSAFNQPQFPTGSFTHRVPGHFTRDYVLEFHDDGTWTTRLNDGIVSSGEYDIQGDEIVFVSDKYCDANQKGPATYNWTFENDDLCCDVKSVDPCITRQSIIDHVLHHKEP